MSGEERGEIREPNALVVTDVKEAIRLLADHAERNGADPNDDDGKVRALVTAHGLGFEAWFCVCCELADREAQRAGYHNQGERAADMMLASQARREAQRR